MASKQDKNLHDACSKGRLRKVREILEHGGDVVSMLESRLGFLGYTPLHEAACQGHDDILQLLLIYGGNKDAKANGNYTPLHIAASMNYVKCIEVLLKNNANIKALDDFRKTPYQTAMQHRRKEAARCLKSAEIIRAAKDSPQELESLLKETLTKEITETCFDQALIEASHAGNFESARMLLVAGAVKMNDCIGIAIKKGHYRVAALLLLCYAAYNENISVLESLLDESFDCFEYLEQFIDKLLPLETIAGQIRSNLRMDTEDFTAVAVQMPGKTVSKPAEVLKVLLLNTSCRRDNGRVNWSKLTLGKIYQTWLEPIMTWVQDFNLSSNKLTSLPEKFIDLKLVARLNLSGNKLKVIPAHIFSLLCLRDLNISSNAISELPEIPEWRPGLKILNVSDNNLCTLPQSISRSCVETLNLSKNNFSKVPLCVCEITMLKDLDLSDNREINFLPNEMGKLRNLTQLELKNLDQITDPPERMRQNAEDVVAALRMKLRSCEAYYTMKLMLVGKGSQGKTTLVHRLKDDFAYNDNDLTQGVEISDLTIKKGAFYQQYVFKVWDFGGQEDYYATHQCFLSTMSLYLLVWRLIDGEEGVRGLTPWLDNIAVRSPGSTVIIVGTHLDCITPEKYGQNYVSHLKNMVYNLVQKPRYKDKVKVDPSRGICAVSCAVGDNKRRAEIISLRQTIYDEAGSLKKGRVSLMGELIPSSFFSLIERIERRKTDMLKKKQPPIIRKEEFHAMVKENSQLCKRDIDDPHDVRDATIFLSERGIVMHFDDPNEGLSDLYFIDPRWLCSLMARVVTVKSHADLVKEGILELEETKMLFISDVLPFDFAPQYIRLLVRFQVAYRLDKSRLLVPSKLPENEPKEVKNMLLPFVPVRRVYKIDYQRIHGFWTRFMSRFLFYVKEMIGVDPTRYQKSKDTEHGFSANFCRACVRVENSSRQCPCFAYTAEWTEKETTEKKSKSSPSASAKSSPKPSMRSSRPPTNRSSAKQTPKKKLPVDDELQALFLDPTVKLFTEAELADDDDVDAVVINNVNTAMMYNRSPSSLAKKKKESVKKIHVGIRVPSYDGSTIYRAKKSNSTPSRSSQNARAAADEDRPQKDCEEQSSFEKADPAKEMNPCDDNEIPRNETPGQEGEVGSEKEPIIGNSGVHKTSSASAASFTSDQTDGYLSDSERCNDSSLSSRTNSVSESSSSFRSPTNSFLGSDPLPEIGNVYSSDFKRDSCCYNDSRIPGRMSTTESFTSEDQTDLDDESSVRSDLSFSQSIDHPAVSLPPGIHSRANSTESKTSDENGYHVDTVADANAAEPRFVGTDTTDDIAVDDDEAAIAKDCLADPEEDVSRNQNDISAMDMSNSECHLAGATVNVTDKSDVPLLTGDVINTVDEVTNENATISSVRAKFDGNIKDDGADDGTHDVMDGANTEMDDSPNECNEVLSDESNANFDHQFTKTLENSDTYPSSSCNSYVGSHDNKNHCPCQEPNAANNLEKTCHASTNNSTLGMSDPEGIDPETGPQAIDVATEKCTLCKEIVALDEMVTIPLDVAELIEKKFLQCWRSGICLNHPELFIAVAHHPLSDTIVVESAVSPSPLGRRLLTFVVDHLDTLIKEWYPGLLLSFGAEPTVQKLIPCRVCEKNGIPRPHRFTFDSCVTQCSMGNFVRCPRHEVSIQDIAPDVVLQDIDSDLLLEEDEIEYENTDVNKIGDGSFGKVYRGRCRDKDAAIKEYSTAITEEDALKRYCEVRRELNILRCVGQHPFLVNLIGVCLRPFRLVLELALEGSLAMTLFNPSFLMDRVVVFRMIYQVANALNFLHGLNVIYRDLKPENVLVMSYAERDDVNIKLTDFGTATFQFAEGLHAVEGTPGYHAPEMLEEFSKRTGYDEKVDVFSLAMLMYGFITRRRPFFSVNSSAEINHLVSLGRQPEYDDVMVARIGLASLTWLMEKCMQYEPYMRPNSGVVAAQLRSPAFQIFLGLIALPCPQSVRHVVFVEGTRELWVAVDDKATNLVLVYELEKIRLKKKFTINRVSRKDLPLCMQVNCMHVATTDVLIGLRGDHDVVTLHDIVTYELKARIVLLEPVFCLSSNDDYIFLGMSSGAFRIVPIANNGEARTVEVSHTDPINCMVAVDKFLWLMVAKCIQIFYTEEVDSVRAFELNSVRFSSSTSSFSQAILSMDKKAVWCVSKGDSIVTGWDVDTRQKICDIDCKSVLSQVSSEDEPVTAVDAIVTCIQVVFDTVWIGTGGGMVLILDAQSGELITWMHLFDDHVRTLTLILGPGPCSTEKCYVVASGKNVLESALSRGGKVVCRLAEDVIKPAPTVQSPTKGLERSKTKTRTNSLSKSRTSPFHRASPSSKNRTSPSSKYRTSPKSPMSDGTGPDAEDGGVNSRTTGGVLLFFEGLPAEVLRRIEARS